MEILVNFVLVEFFRPVKHSAKPPEHVCGTRIVVAISAQKERRKKIEVYVGKNSITDSRAAREPLTWGLSPYNQPAHIKCHNFFNF